MIKVGFIEPDDAEDERAMWDRARRTTHEYWRPKLSDDLK